MSNFQLSKFNAPGNVSAPNRLCTYSYSGGHYRHSLGSVKFQLVRKILSTSRSHIITSTSYIIINQQSLLFSPDNGRIRSFEHVVSRGEGLEEKKGRKNLTYYIAEKVRHIFRYWFCGNTATPRYTRTKPHKIQQFRPIRRTNDWQAFRRKKG